MQKGRVEVLSIRLTWVIIAIWFGANLLSQAIYIGFNGQPYDANAILSSLGYWYWVCIAIELFIWLALGLLVINKLRIKTQEEGLFESV